MPDAAGLELIAQEINAGAEGAVVETAHERGRATLIAEPSHLLHTLTWLRDTDTQSYTFLASVHGADYLPAEPRFAVHYELLNMARVERVSVKALVADTGDPDVLPVVPSAVGLFPTAEFQEREVYDFFGIEFEGHPDMRRILMPEDYAGWPQRRDFPVGGEPVLFTHNEVESPRWYE